MSKRSVTIHLLTLAFLLGAWGNIIAAAFCPHYLVNAANAVKAIALEPKHVGPSSCHHEMADKEMDDMQMDDTTDEPGANLLHDAIPGDHSSEKTSAQEVSFDLPDTPCGHCWMHSQTSSGPATLVVIPSKQLIVTSAPAIEVAVDVTGAATVSSIVPLGHGPPRNLLARHVLIKVFRI